MCVCAHVGISPLSPSVFEYQNDGVNFHFDPTVCAEPPQPRQLGSLFGSEQQQQHTICVSHLFIYFFLYPSFAWNETHSHSQTHTNGELLHANRKFNLQ